MGGRWYEQRVYYPYYAYAAFLVLICIGALCLNHYIKSFSRNEARTLGHGSRLAKAIDDYMFQKGEYPSLLTDVEPNIKQHSPWPVNPFTNRPVVDTGDVRFDPLTSPGNACYERIIAGEGTEGYDAVLAQSGQVGYRLHVFGEDGVLRVYTGGRQSGMGTGDPPVAVLPTD